MNRYYAIKSITGKTIVKQYRGKSDDQAIEKAYTDDKIADVIEEILAKNVQTAIKKAQREFSYV